MPNDKDTLFRRLAGQPGKGVGARTGLGTANVVIPEFPPLPRAVTPSSADQFRIAVDEWRQQLQSQFPIPIPDPFDPSELQSQLDSLLATSTSNSEAITALQQAQADCCLEEDITALLAGKANVFHTHGPSDVSGLGSMALQNSDNVNISGGVIEGYYGLHAAAVYEFVKNVSASTIAKGTPVYIVGRTGTHIDVAPADASNAAMMPAIGVAQDAIAQNDNGYIHVIGTVTGVDTSSATLGQTIYVASGGGFTTTKPAYPNLIQNMGRVTKVASNGEILVLGPGRTNDVPALANLNVFIGNSGGQAVQRQLVPSDIQGLATSPANEDWTYRVGQVVVRSGATDLLGETASTSAGTATNVNPDGVQLYTQNYATAATLNADAGFASSTPHVTTAAPRFAIYFRLMQLTDVRCLVLLTDTAITTHLAADVPTSGNFIGFRFSSSASDVNWKVISRDGTVANVVDTGVAADTNPHLLELRSDGNGTSFSAYIDGTLAVGNITLNLPSTTALLTVKAGIRALVATAKNFRWSYFRLAERELP